MLLELLLWQSVYEMKFAANIQPIEHLLFVFTDVNAADIAYGRILLRISAMSYQHFVAFYWPCWLVVPCRRRQEGEFNVKKLNTTKYQSSAVSLIERFGGTDERDDVIELIRVCVR